MAGEEGNKVEAPVEQGGEDAQPQAKKQKVAVDAEAEATARKVHTLYHLGMPAEVAQKSFKDVKFICVGGTEDRMERMAEMVGAKLGAPVEKLAQGRFAVFKAGCVVTCNHGMGQPSLSICMNELIQALRLADNKEDVKMFRVGTTGGIGVEPGSVVVTSEALNERLEPFYEVIYMGEDRKYPTHIDPEMLKELSSEFGPDMVVGKTMAANCFYDNQGRVDGAFADHTLEDRQAFLEKLHAAGVRNIEMEGVAFTALARRAKIKAAILCVVLVNRLKGEQPTAPANKERAMEVVVEYIGRHAGAA